MSLAEALAQTDERQRGITCGVTRVLETLTGDDLAAFRGALVPNSGVSHRRLSRVLREQANLNLSDQAIGRHRRGDCSCEESS